MKTYQNVKLKGISPNKNYINSKFYNEGKWNNYIAPLLPEDRKEMTFIEFGSNAGLYLKMAEDKGFKTIVGVDKSKSHCKVARRYQKNLVINKSIGENFDFNTIPIADVVVMANIHYHMRISDFLLFTDRLRFKTRYLILVSAKNTPRHWRAAADKKSIENYFKEWKLIKYIKPLPLEGDCCPRETFSFLFESDLKRVEMKNIFRERNGEKIMLSTYKLMNRLASEVLNNNTLDARQTSFYKKLLKRLGDNESFKRANKSIAAMYDIKKNGMRNPIILQKSNKIIDGDHRFAVLNELGYKTIIARMV